MIAFALGEGLSQLMGMEHIRMCAQATCTQCQQEESSSWNLQLNAVLAERHCKSYARIFTKQERKANNYNRCLGFSKDYRLSR